MPTPLAERGKIRNMWTTTPFKLLILLLHVRWSASHVSFKERSTMDLLVDDSTYMFRRTPCKYYLMHIKRAV
jgi:hypothetical protein